MVEFEPVSPAQPRILSDEQRRSLADLYLTNFTVVTRVCRRILGNPDDAADAAHEVFLKAVEALPPGIAGETARPWLFAVARNHCLDVLRRRKRFDGNEHCADAVLEDGVDPEKTTMNRQTVAAVFGKLQVRERQALWQSAVEGRPLAGIADNLGLSYMAAAQLLHRARQRASRVGAQVVAAVTVFIRNPFAGAPAQAAGRLVPLAVLTLALASVGTSNPPHQTPAAPPSISDASRPTTPQPAAASTHRDSRDAPPGTPEKEPLIPTSRAVPIPALPLPIPALPIPKAKLPTLPIPSPTSLPSPF